MKIFRLCKEEYRFYVYTSRLIARSCNFIFPIRKPQRNSYIKERIMNELYEKTSQPTNQQIMKIEEKTIHTVKIYGQICESIRTSIALT